MKKSASHLLQWVWNRITLCVFWLVGRSNIKNENVTGNKAKWNNSFLSSLTNLEPDSLHHLPWNLAAMTSIPVDFTTQASSAAPSHGVKCSCGKKPVGQCDCEKVSFRCDTTKNNIVCCWEPKMQLREEDRRTVWLRARCHWKRVSCWTTHVFLWETRRGRVYLFSCISPFC